MNNLEHPYKEPTRYLNLDCTSVPYWKIGEGPNLVFVHGWPLDSRTWRNVVSALKSHFTCHLFDLPGAGLSRWNPNQDFTYSALAVAVGEAIAKMGLEEFILIGHDSGGGLARVAGEKMGNRVAGMVLGNTEVPQRYSPLFRFLFAAGRLPMARQLFSFILGHNITRAPFELTSPRKYPELRQELNEMFLRPLLTNQSKLSAALALLQRFEISDFDSLREVHARLNFPVQLVWGRLDRWFPLEHAQNMVEQFAGGCHLEVVDQAGLLVHEECPDLFAGVVSRFAATVSSEQLHLTIPPSRDSAPACRPL